MHEDTRSENNHYSLLGKHISKMQTTLFQTVPPPVKAHTTTFSLPPDHKTMFIVLIVLLYVLCKQHGMSFAGFHTGFHCREGGGISFSDTIQSIIMYQVLQIRALNFQVELALHIFAVHLMNIILSL